MKSKVVTGARLWRTIRYLKFRQLVYRVYYKFRRVKVTTPAQLERRKWATAWNGETFQNPSTLDGRIFKFLGEEAELGSDWNSATFSKLWLYNLHYLDNLNSNIADQQQDINSTLINRWISNNPLMTGNGWEPYVLSLRVVNLVKWFSLHEVDSVSWLKSLGAQASALARQPEYHILGNHLFANGKGLTFAGAFLAGKEADRWLEQGLGILDLEVAEQFLPDGAHFELSPMYHATLLWDLCDLIHLAEISHHRLLLKRVGPWQKVVNQGIEWLRFMVHPDGDIGFFNDSALGIAPTLADIECYAGQVGCLPKTTPPKNSDSWNALHLTASGYITVDHSAHNHRALIDAAKVGPDYQPGHAHADTLSFELSLFGQRVFVNSGTSQYGEDEERHRQRSTAAHNTVEVDGKNSSEIWAGFRVARRALPTDISVSINEGCVDVSASHTGYLRLPGKVAHSRQWTFEANKIVVSDKLNGSFSVGIARFYCHPAVTVSGDDRDDKNSIRLHLEGGQTVTAHFEGANRLIVREATWHPRFGETQPNQCIEVELSDQKVVSSFSWSTD